MMDQEISTKEIKAAIKKMKLNKTPGPDGYPIEFFRKFTDLLAPSMKQTYDSILHRRILPPSWSETTLIPILKPDKDPLLCSSYTLIALINVDAKIFTSILATRLQRIITGYIHTDQTDFIPTRSMADNIRKVLNIIRLGKKDKVPSLLLALDFEKAFDSGSLIIYCDC